MGMEKSRGSQDQFSDLQHEQTLKLQGLTLQEGIRQWLQLQMAFEGQLQQSAAYFTEDRRKALAELQIRLNRLVD